MNKLRFMAAFMVAFVVGHNIYAAMDDASIQEEIKKILNNRTANELVKIGNHVLYSQHALPILYKQKEFNQIWDNKKRIEEILTILGNADREGLDLENYRYTALRQISQSNLDDPIKQAEFDMLVTDAALLYFVHLKIGKGFRSDGLPGKTRVEKISWVNQSFDSILTSADLPSAFKRFGPKMKAYRILKERLASYFSIKEKGGWPEISVGESIKAGSIDGRIPVIRERLKISGHYKGGLKTSEIDKYDDLLKSAVIQFKKENDLIATDEIDKITQQTLNISVDDRINQIKVNLERYRWMPEEMGTEYAFVNIPDFTLEMVDNDSVRMRMDVGVGKVYRKTPVFSSQMTHLVINPFWTVPPTIFANDMLPAIRKDIGYLKRNNMKVIAVEGNSVKEIDPYSINWSLATPAGFPYKLRQDPGPSNALGTVKFMFPNQFNVYMHDTNHREIFDLRNRAVSSGCIRLGKPMELVKYMLTRDEGWTPEAIQKVVATTETKTINLKKPIYVHIQYLTAFVDTKGRINFRADIYDRDNQVLEILAKPPVSEYL